jgi:RNase P/RNase MRP subunit p30
LSYFESRLPVDFDDFKVLNHKLEICKRLRIKNLILEPKNELFKIPGEIKYKIEEQNTQFNIFYRINLRVNNLENFKKLIKKFNKFHDILSIESLNKEVQLQAARDSRVDIISFSNQDIIRTLTPGVVSLSKQNNSFIEFSLAPIMVNNKAIQSKNFRNLYKFIQLAFKFKSNCIISGNFDEIYDLRHPRALVSICHSLLGISLVNAKRIFTINPLTLLERVKKRSNANFDLDVKLIKGDELS